MQNIFSKKNESTTKTAKNMASAVHDSSSQGVSLQRKADMANGAVQREERPNNTGMPDNLKAGIESLSGFSMDDVRVHYNSPKPATVQALAYTQGTDIHVAPGQEKYLPHEAWHVAQQMAGRVSPTTNINGMPVNDNTALEHEADVMGERALQRKVMECSTTLQKGNCDHIVQCMSWEDISLSWADISQRFNLDDSACSRVAELGYINPALAEWMHDALGACQYVNHVDNNSPNYQSTTDTIYGSDRAGYPGKLDPDTKLRDEMKVITILHELMHTAVRNGAYQKNNGVNNKVIIWGDQRKDYNRNAHNSNIEDWNVSANNNRELATQFRFLLMNAQRLKDICIQEMPSRTTSETLIIIETRISHLLNCPCVEYDAVLGDLVYYMMRKGLTRTRTYNYANILLEDANKRRHDSKLKLGEIDEDGMSLYSPSASEYGSGDNADSVYSLV